MHCASQSIKNDTIDNLFYNGTIFDNKLMKSPKK